MNKKVIVAIIVLACLLGAFIIFSRGGRLSGFSSKESIIINTQLDQEYSEVRQGDPIFIGINLIRLGGGERKDYIVNTIVEDADGLRTSISSQTIALDTTASLVVKIDTSRRVDSDSYNIIVEVRDSQSNELLSTAAQRIVLFKDFYIKVNYKDLLYFVSIFLIVVVVLLIIIWRTITRKAKGIKRI